MNEYDDVVVSCFIEKQTKLFPEKIVETKEEAQDFLCDCMAVVVDSAREVMEYFLEEGVDLEEMSEEELLQAEEVFEIGDGRYLIIFF